jgi:hypothetical protein
MSELELRLTALRDEIDWPETPAFEALTFEPGLERTPARRLPLRPLALAFAVLLAVLAGVLAFSPGARSAFLEIFHIRGATVERVENLPDVRAQRLDYGERVTREEAELRSGFQVLDLGSKPDAFFIRPDGLVSAVYGDPARPRVVLSQARGAIFDGFMKKTGGSGTIVRFVTVKGQPGLFVTGDEHYVMFRDRNGNIADERTYLAGTVLLWNRGPLLLRLEGDMTFAEARKLANSVE